MRDISVKIYLKISALQINFMIFLISRVAYAGAARCFIRAILASNLRAS